MLRWNTQKRGRSENADVDAFIADLVSVCRKHKLSLGHEDSHGEFQIESFSEHNIEWLSAAHDATDEQI